MFSFLFQKSNNYQFSFSFLLYRFSKHVSMCKESVNFFSGLKNIFHQNYKMLDTSIEDNSPCEIDIKISELISLILAQECLDTKNEYEFDKIIEKLVETQYLVIKKLNEWKCEQFRIANYLSSSLEMENNNSELDHFQNWFDKLYTIIGEVQKWIEIIYTIQMNNLDKNKLKKHHDTVLNLQRKLILSCIVIEKQPPQVIKKDSR